ncbi:MarR family winged helix-turn-helix transcriptional regulator [Aestuariimicrobium soli]|uniref:MarR family winged helix-turn-helix transcriptional regulator n=1 Tax=Aestuariimicrobium soli TaxID=2035834 RepID=UPI003EB8FF86
MTDRHVLGPEASDRDLAIRRLEQAMELLGRRIRDYYREVAEQLDPGLQPHTFKVLVCIDRLAPVSVSALTEQLASDKGQVSRSVSELESRGLVLRTSDPRDARVRLVEPTPQARERLEHARHPFSQLLRESVNDWGVDEVDDFSSLLEKMAGAVVPR